VVPSIYMLVARKRTAVSEKNIEPESDSPYAALPPSPVEAYMAKEVPQA
jgi:hypothetical protein